MRVVSPPVAGPLRFGFIKRLNATSGGRVSLRFEYRFSPARAGVNLEIGLACASGRRFVQQTAANGQGMWSVAQLQFAVPEGDGLEAAYIVASTPDADPDVAYRLLIDHVKLQAARHVQFELHDPSALLIDPWPALIAASAYRPGQRIPIRATAPISLESASCVLRDPEGNKRAGAPLKRSGGFWTGSLNAPSGPEATGIWSLDLRGATVDGRALETSVRLLVSPAASAHPRLYFDPADRQELRSRARLPQAAGLWAQLEQMAKTSRDTGDLGDGGRITALLDRRFLLPTLPAYFDFATRASNRIAYNALIGYVDGVTDARAAAKRAMLEVAQWPTWTPPWFEAHGQHTYYPAGMLAADMALGYDLLYDDFTPDERAMLRRALIERAVAPVWREYVLDNRVMANTSNWIAHTVGGALIALAAIYGDEHDPRLIAYAGGLLRKLEDHMAASYLGDGSYGEGISYQEFDLFTLTQALTAAHRVFGVNEWTRTNVTKSLGYQINVLAQPAAETQDMGDSHPPSGYSIAGLVRHSNDSVMRWYYDQFAHKSINDFLFFPGAAPQHSPDGLASRLFPVRGNAVFRTGWGPDDWILLFRAGPNFNHNHADQGSFLLRAFGENLAVDSGYADYYKDPYYATYFSQAAGHNTVLVDGDPASQSVADTRQFAALDAHPRITEAITSDFYDSVTSELESVYGGRLRRFTRRIVFVKPRYVVVRDELAAAGGPASYEWLLHVSDRNGLRTDESGALYRGEKAAFSLRVLSPSQPALTVATGHLPYSTFNPFAPKTVPLEPGILDVRSQPSMRTEFLIAIAAARSGEAARSVTGAMRPSAGENCTALKTPDETIAFRTAEAGVARCDAVSADAAAWMIAIDHGNVRRLAGERARRIETGGRLLLASDAPVNFSAQWLDNAIDLWTNSSTGARMRIFTPWIARGAHMTEVAVAAGEHFAHIPRSAP